MGIAVSSGNTTIIATDSCANGLHQIVKISDGSANSIATVSASALYGLQVDVSRMPSAALLGIPSVTANIYNTPSVAPTTHSVTSMIYNSPSVTISQGLNVSASQIGSWNINASLNGISSVALLAAAEVHAEQLGGWNVSLSGSPSVTLFGTPSVAILGNITTSPNVSLTGLPSVTLYGIPSVAIMGTINTGNSSVSQLDIWNVSASQIGNFNVSASQLGTWSVALLANPSITVGALYGTPSVAPTTHSVTAMIYNTPSFAPTTHSVTAMIYNTPSVAPTAIASVASIKKFLNVTNTATAPVVLWSNIATTRWCLTDLTISANNTVTVTLFDGIASIAQYYFMPYGGMVTNFSTPLKSGGIGSNIMITAVGTASTNFTAIGYETT